MGRKFGTSAEHQATTKHPTIGRASLCMPPNYRSFNCLQSVEIRRKPLTSHLGRQRTVR